MAVSSQSLQHQYKDYVNPWDLNIFASILQNKQQKYDQGAATVQSRLDGFASLDVLADSDKEYLNSKINETVKGINNLGGADLSDNSVVSQLSGHVGNIGQDERIINAVMDTKKIRTMQAGRAQINKDFNSGKKGVYRSDANEYFENQNINKYLEAKKADPTARYDGPMAPIAYSDYHKRLADAAKSIKASSIATFSPTNNAYMYMLKDGKSVTEEQVATMAATALTEEDRGQMARDGQYHYKNASDEQILDEYNSSNNRAIAKLNYQIQNASAIYGVEAPKAKEQLIAQKDQYTKDIQDRKLSMQKVLTSDRASAINQVFMNRYTEGLVSRYAYKEEKLKPVFDQGAMMTARLNQQAAIANRDLALKERDLTLKLTENAAKHQADLQKFTLDAREKGYDVDQSTGRLIEGTGVKGGSGGTSGTAKFIDTSQPGDTQPAVIDFLRSENDQLKTSIDRTTTSFYNEYAKKVDEDGSQGLFKLQGTNYVPTEKWKKANQSLVQAADDLVNGRPTAITSLPKEFVQYKEQRKALELLQNANQDRIDGMRNAANENTRANLKATNTMSDADWELYKRGKDIYNKLPDVMSGAGYTVGQGGEVHESPKTKTKDLSKISAKDQAAYAVYDKYYNRVQPIYDKEIGRIQLEESKQLNHIGTTFSKKELENKGLMGAIISQRNNYYVMNSDNGIVRKPEETGELLTNDNFDPIGKVRGNFDGKGERAYVVGNMTTGSGDKKETSRIYIPVDAQTSQSIDAFAASPSAHIERAIETSPTKSIRDISYGVPRGGRVDAAADFKVIQLSEGRNIIKVKQPYGPDGKPLSEPNWITLPEEYKTAAEAHQNGKAIVPVFQQAREQFKAKKVNLSFRDYVLKRAQAE